MEEMQRKIERDFKERFGEGGTSGEGYKRARFVIGEKERVLAVCDAFVEEAKKRFNEKYGHEPKIYDGVIPDGERKVLQ